MKSTFAIDTDLKNQKPSVSETGVRDFMTRADFYNMSQISKKYGWSVNVIKQEMDSGRLESRKVAGRFYSTQEQIDKWNQKI